MGLRGSGGAAKEGQLELSPGSLDDGELLYSEAGDWGRLRSRGKPVWPLTVKKAKSLSRGKEDFERKGTSCEEKAHGKIGEEEKHWSVAPSPIFQQWPVKVNQSGDWQMILSIEEINTSLITIYRRIERRIDHRLKHVLPASNYNMSPERSKKSASLHTKPRNRTLGAEPTKHSIERSPLPSVRATFGGELLLPGSLKPKDETEDA